jgi:hypothetical protein
MNSREFWDLEFSVEVSTLYHDWRRASLWSIVEAIKAITLVGAIIAFVSLNFNSQLATLIIALASAFIAVVTIVDLVWRFSWRAERHETLYKRFKELQAEIEQMRISADDEKSIAGLNSKAQQIRVDEPPTLWAVYAKAWNQAIEHHRIDETYYRHIAPWRRLLGKIVKFDPQDFPIVARQTPHPAH